MEILQFKKVIFYSDKIVFLKKNITIHIKDIRKIHYRKPTFINCFLAGLFSTYPDGPGVMVIWLNKKINKTDYYAINIRYKNVLKLPKEYQKLIDTSLFGI